MSEQVGDYMVRYADPVTSLNAFTISGRIAELLAPWGAGRATDTYTGPGITESFPLPITAHNESGLPWWEAGSTGTRIPVTLRTPLPH